MSDTDVVLCGDGTILCQSCAGDWCVDRAQDWRSWPQPTPDVARRLAAAVRLASIHAGGVPYADAIRRTLADAPVLLADAVNHCSWVGPPIGSPEAVAHAYAMVGPRHQRAERTRAALAAFDQEVHALWSWETSDSYWGEYCEGCGVVLEEPWITCNGCGHDDAADRFPFVDGHHVDSDGDRPTVDRCGRCDDND